MSKRRARRRYTADEKLRILEEARQRNTLVAEMLRRHQVDAATFYRWERQARDAMRSALDGRHRDGKGEARELVRLRSEVVRSRKS